jgi:hypothetical protein
VPCKSTVQLLPSRPLTNSCMVPRSCPGAQAIYYWRYNTYTSAAQDKEVEKGTNGTASSSRVCCEWNLQQHHLLSHEQQVIRTEWQQSKSRTMQDNRV